MGCVHLLTGKRDLKPELLRSPYQDGKFIKVYKEEDVINIARQKAKKTGRYEIIEKILGEKDDVEKYKTRLNKRMQSRLGIHGPKVVDPRAGGAWIPDQGTILEMKRESMRQKAQKRLSYSHY